MSAQHPVQSFQPTRPGPSLAPSPIAPGFTPAIVPRIGQSPYLPDTLPHWMHAAQPHLALALLMY